MKPQNIARVWDSSAIAGRSFTDGLQKIFDVKASSPRKFYLYRLFTTVALSLCCSLALYAVLGGFSETGGISYTFLFILPVILTISSSVSLGIRSTSSNIKLIFYPLILFIFGAIALSVFIGEAALCIAMLVIPWTLLSILTSVVVILTRRLWPDENRLYSAAILIVPFFCTYAEMQIEPPNAHYVVENSVIVDTGREDIWPLLLKLDAIEQSEGTSNFTQSILHIPRPTSAIVSGEGVGAVRHAEWGANARFEERIYQWQPERSLSWKFTFPDDSIRQHTDRHIAPDGPHLFVEEGGYRLTPLKGGKTRLTLWTRYNVNTHMNGYAALWGSMLLNDIQNNILHIVKHRAES